MYKNLLLSVLLIFTCLLNNLLLAQEPQARYPHEDVNNWGRWGENDQKGAGNYITAELIVKAAQLIKSGKTFSLAIPIDKLGPTFYGSYKPLHFMETTGVDYSTIDQSPYTGDMKYAKDALFMSLHATTSWDALSHAWYGDQLYNGYPEQEIVSRNWGGARKLGIQNMKDSFIGRGVLIDIVAYMNDTIPKGYLITRQDIENALKKQGTEVNPGDMVLLRTGVVPSWFINPGPIFRYRFHRPQTGIARDVVLWIKEKQIAAIAADNMGLERQPNSIDPNTISPLHGNILRDLGVYIGEIFYLEDLAADCKKDGVYEFFLAAQPLNIPGATASPINPIAIK